MRCPVTVWMVLMMSSPAQALDLRTVPSSPAPRAAPSAISPAAIQQAPIQTVVAKPVVTGFQPTGCVRKGGTVTVQGNGFGSPDGKAVALGGNSIHVDLAVSTWGASAIIALIPNNPRIQAGKNYYIGVEKAGHAAWLSNIDKNVTICASSALSRIGAARIDSPRLVGRTADGAAPSSGEEPEAYYEEGGGYYENTGGSYGVMPPSGGGSLLESALPPPPQNLPPVPPKDTPTIEPGELIVVSPGMAEAQALAQQMQALGLSVKRRTALSGLGLVVSVLRVPKESTVGNALAGLRETMPKVWADANHRYELLGEEANRYGRKLIGWNSAAHCGKGLRIGLLDSAVDANHPALRGRAITAKSFLAAGIAPAPADHGTATAALLVANSTPSGLAGLLPSAQLYAANIFRDRGKKQVDTTAEWIALALDWLAGQRVSIVNMSLGGPRNLLVEAAVRRLQERGIAIVAAAGNSGEKSLSVYPAAQDGVVAVTAVDARLNIYRNATRGDYIAFSAPGVDIWTAAPGKDGIYVSGTSYAAPFVTAALASAHLVNPKTPWRSLQQQLQKKSRDLGIPGKDPVFGWGLVQTSGCAATKQH